jgi:hypothetical protein
MSRGNYGKVDLGTGDSRFCLSHDLRSRIQTGEVFGALSHLVAAQNERPALRERTRAFLTD